MTDYEIACTVVGLGMALAAAIMLLVGCALALRGGDGPEEEWWRDDE